jgi:hypothetical protein
VISYQFGVEWRQLAMPIHDLRVLLIVRTVHRTPGSGGAKKSARQSRREFNDVERSHEG